MGQANPLAGTLGEGGLNDVAVRQGQGRDDFRGNLALMPQVVMADELAEKRLRREIQAVLGHMVASAEHAAATHGQCADAEAAGALGQSEDVGIAVPGIDDLAFLQAAQLLDLVAQACGFLAGCGGEARGSPAPL